MLQSSHRRHHVCVKINRNTWQTIQQWTHKSCPYKGKIFITEQYQAERSTGICRCRCYDNVLLRDLPAYQKLHITGMAFRHAHTAHLGVHALLNYQFAQMTWNPQFNLNDLTQAYFQFNYQTWPNLWAIIIRDWRRSGKCCAWKYELHDRIIDAVVKRQTTPIVPLQKLRIISLLMTNRIQVCVGQTGKKTYLDIFEVVLFLRMHCWVKYRNTWRTGFCR